ncbi:hypothetical protein ABTD55_22170, partial [Acinetobacter baumannii]
VLVEAALVGCRNLVPVRDRSRYCVERFARRKLVGALASHAISMVLTDLAICVDFLHPPADLAAISRGHRSRCLAGF